MSGFTRFIRYLSLSIAAGEWNKASLSERIEQSLHGHFENHNQLAARLLFHFEEGLPHSRKQLIDFLLNQNLLHRFYEAQEVKQDPRILLEPPVMGPLPKGMVTLPLPQLSTWKDLRQWLGLFDGELAWFADREGRQNNIAEPKLHHYRYRWITKRSGLPRLIEIPKPRMKMIQRQILKGILGQVPPHHSAHGFTRGRSGLTYVTQHVSKEVVLRMDLKDFFHSVPTPRIGALFQRLGYPPTVAHLLQALCTHATSAALVGDGYQKLVWERQKQLKNKHLPQGAPSSPAIANLCAWRLDCRLQGLAERFGLDYTRYADDLAFSGPRELIRQAPRLQEFIGAIALDEGFEINHRKTRLRTQAQPQRLAGMVINQRPNLSRTEYDQLKATLYNCIRYGPDSQNRQDLADFKSHLAGRISHANWINPQRGERLRSLWQRIQWPDRDLLGPFEAD